MTEAHTDPPTNPTIRQERRSAGGALEDQISQQKQLIFEMFQRGDSRAAIKQERDRLRFLQRQQTTGATGIVADEAVQEFLSALERPPTQRIERGTDRKTRDRTTARVTGQPVVPKQAELLQLETLIEQERRIIYQMFERGEERDTIKSHRDKLRLLERQHQEMGTAVVEADERLDMLARKRSPSRYLRMLVGSVPVIVLAVVVQVLRFDPLHLVAPWWGQLSVVVVATALLSLLWWRCHHPVVLGVLFPLSMFALNGVCISFGLLGEPNWSLALGFIVWLFLGVGLAFTDGE